MCLIILCYRVFIVTAITVRNEKRLRGDQDELSASSHWKRRESFPRPPSPIFYPQNRQPRYSTRTNHPTLQRPAASPYSSTYSTIAARALSFQGQLLTGAMPLQLAQNGLHYKLPGFSSSTARCLPVERSSLCPPSSEPLSKRNSIST